jgi:hypothetical protein
VIGRLILIPRISATDGRRIGRPDHLRVKQKAA